MTPRAVFVSLLLLPVAAAACSPVVTLAPPAAPPPSLPAVGAPPVGADSGLARVLVSTDVPASVSRIVHVYRGPSRELLCERTPCALTMPYGDYELELSASADPDRTSTVIAHVNASTVAVNHILGVRHASPGRAPGAVLLGLGVLTVLVGVAVAGAGAKAGGSSGERTAGGEVALAGLGVIALGGLVLAASPTTEQQGATTEWSPPAAKPVGGSLGFKF